MAKLLKFKLLHVKQKDLERREEEKKVHSYKLSELYISHLSLVAFQKIPLINLFVFQLFSDCPRRHCSLPNINLSVSLSPLASFFNSLPSPSVCKESCVPALGLSILLLNSVFTVQVRSFSGNSNYRRPVINPAGKMF